MSLTTILQTGLTALQASQTGLKVTADNISNANTPGYVRTEVSFAPLTYLGGGSGVDTLAIRRAANQFLATADFIARANGGAAQARSDLLARAQTYFGDPTGQSSVFSVIDQVWSAFTGLQTDPSSSLARDKAVGAIEGALALTAETAASVQALIAEADERVGGAVSQAQSLMQRIAQLNDEIRLTLRAGGEATAVQNKQSALIDELADIVDVRVEPREDGGVIVRTSGGALLVGAQAATLSYTASGSAYAVHEVIAFNEDLGAGSNLEPYLLGGELKGLLQARDQDLPAIAEALGGYVAALADQLNAVHNENASAPAAPTLTGRQTGLLGADEHNFTGTAVVAVVDSSGVLSQRLTIDFDAGTITGESPAAVQNFAATVGGLVTALNTALGAATPAGSASFTSGVLTLNAPGGGLVVQQDSADPSGRAGRGFAHFFGLNDLIGRDAPLFFEAGLESTDPHGLVAGGRITFQVKDPNGRVAAVRAFDIAGAPLTAGGSTFATLASALNASVTGIGEFATFAIDADGRLGFTPRTGYSVDILEDTTARGTTGVSLSGLFGLTPAARAGRATETTVRDAISDDPTLLAVGRPELSLAAIGDNLIELGDARGAAALVNARDQTRTFPAAGALSQQTTTLALYASRLGGAVGRLAGDADNAAKGAAAVSAAATDRRSQVESVNVDDEFLQMTTYQNSYAAAARIIQAANEMFDILMAIGVR
jgi:flagellar hook-associated protein 1 FlgK